MKTRDNAHLFRKVVEEGSFHKAAELLGISAPMASRSIKKLENDLGVTLLKRTTRSLSLTEEGTIFYESCIRIEEEQRLTQQRLQNLKAKPTGLLKISVTRAFCQAQLVKALCKFSISHPDIRFEIDSSDQQVDLAESGIDLAIRIGKLKDSRLKSRRLMHSMLIPVASSNYLNQFSAPKHIEDLKDHQIITTSHLPNVEKRQMQMLPEGLIDQNQKRIIVNDVVSVKQAVCADAGLSYLPLYLIEQELQSGELVELFKGHSRVAHDIYIVYAAGDFMPHKTRIFIDYLAEHFA